MATNYRQPGETITMTAPTGGIKSGEGRMFGALFGVAHYDALEGAPVEVGVVGVWVLPKPNSVVTFAAGAASFGMTAARRAALPAAGFSRLASRPSRLAQPMRP